MQFSRYPPVASCISSHPPSSYGQRGRDTMVGNMHTHQRSRGGSDLKINSKVKFTDSVSWSPGFLLTHTALAALTPTEHLLHLSSACSASSPYTQFFKFFQCVLISASPLYLTCKLTQHLPDCTDRPPRLSSSPAQCWLLRPYDPDSYKVLVGR